MVKWLRQWTGDLRIASYIPGKIIMLFPWGRRLNSLHPGVEMGTCEVPCNIDACAGVWLHPMRIPRGTCSCGVLVVSQEGLFEVCTLWCVGVISYQ